MWILNNGKNSGTPKKTSLLCLARGLKRGRKRSTWKPKKIMATCRPWPKEKNKTKQKPPKKKTCQNWVSLLRYQWYFCLFYTKLGLTSHHGHQAIGCVSSMLTFIRVHRRGDIGIFNSTYGNPMLRRHARITCSQRSSVFGGHVISLNIPPRKEFLLLPLKSVSDLTSHL
jgi:hypothetical protein